MSSGICSCADGQIVADVSDENFLYLFQCTCGSKRSFLIHILQFGVLVVTEFLKFLNLPKILKFQLKNVILILSFILPMAYLHRVSLSLEAPNYCLCIQSNSVGFSFVNTGRQVHLKHARRHFKRSLVKDVHHRSVASRNWLKVRDKGKPI